MEKMECGSYCKDVINGNDEAIIKDGSVFVGELFGILVEIVSSSSGIIRSFIKGKEILVQLNKSRLYLDGVGCNNRPLTESITVGTFITFKAERKINGKGKNLYFAVLAWACSKSSHTPELSSSKLMEKLKVPALQCKNKYDYNAQKGNILNESQLVAQDIEGCILTLRNESGVASFNFLARDEKAYFTRDNVFFLGRRFKNKSSLAYYLHQGQKIKMDVIKNNNKLQVPYSALVVFVEKEDKRREDLSSTGSLLNEVSSSTVSDSFSNGSSSSEILFDIDCKVEQPLEKGTVAVSNVQGAVNDLTENVAEYSCEDTIKVACDQFGVCFSDELLGNIQIVKGQSGNVTYKDNANRLGVVQWNYEGRTFLIPFHKNHLFYDQKECSQREWEESVLNGSTLNFDAFGVKLDSGSVYYVSLAWVGKKPKFTEEQMADQHDEKIASQEPQSRAHDKQSETMETVKSQITANACCYDTEWTTEESSKHRANEVLHPTAHNISNSSLLELDERKVAEAKTASDNIVQCQTELKKSENNMCDVEKVSNSPNLSSEQLNLTRLGCPHTNLVTNSIPNKCSIIAGEPDDSTNSQKSDRKHAQNKPYRVTECCGSLMCFLSHTEGVLQLNIFTGGRSEIVFDKSMLYVNGELCGEEPLSSYITLGTKLNFNALKLKHPHICGAEYQAFLVWKGSKPALSRKASPQPDAVSWETKNHQATSQHSSAKCTNKIYYGETGKIGVILNSDEVIINRNRNGSSKVLCSKHVLHVNSGSCSQVADVGQSVKVGMQINFDCFRMAKVHESGAEFQCRIAWTGKKPRTSGTSEKQATETEILKVTRQAAGDVQELTTGKTYDGLVTKLMPPYAFIISVKVASNFVEVFAMTSRLCIGGEKLPYDSHVDDYVWMGDEVQLKVRRGDGSTSRGKSYKWVAACVWMKLLPENDEPQQQKETVGCKEVESDGEITYLSVDSGVLTTSTGNMVDVYRDKMELFGVSLTNLDLKDVFFEGQKISYVWRCGNEEESETNKSKHSVINFGGMTKDPIQQSAKIYKYCDERKIRRHVVHQLMQELGRQIEKTPHNGSPSKIDTLYEEKEELNEEKEDKSICKDSEIINEHKKILETVSSNVIDEDRTLELEHAKNNNTRDSSEPKDGKDTEQSSGSSTSGEEQEEEGISGRNIIAHRENECVETASEPDSGTSFQYAEDALDDDDNHGDSEEETSEEIQEAVILTADDYIVLPRKSSTMQFNSEDSETTDEDSRSHSPMSSSDVSDECCFSESNVRADINCKDEEP